MKTACVILAGGAGKRMKSERPKVLAEVLCKPMLGWVLDAAKDFGFDETAVVTGFGAELTGRYVSSRGEAVTLCHQAQQKGTGDAVKSAEDVISRCDAGKHLMPVACSHGRKVLFRLRNHVMP